MSRDSVYSRRTEFAVFLYLFLYLSSSIYWLQFDAFVRFCNMITPMHTRRGV